MAGTIVVDRIESDASYASNINVASQITFSNTVNFGITSVAPVAGFYSPSTNNVAFTTASTERMRITSAGNVGVGTSSPTSKLDLAGGNLTISNSSNAPYINFVENTTRTQSLSRITMDQVSDTAGQLLFSTTTGGTLAERMRIDSSGSLRIGQTSGNADARTTINGGSTDSSPCIDYVKNSSTTTTAQVYARFTANAVGTGSITANGAAAAAFTAWSDRRLKKNITDLPSQLANIMALRPVEFDYVESMGGGHQIGFIAQDVRAIYPDLVGESSDGMLTLTDMNKNDARLIKAIQELKAINDTQAATITALTARVVALES